MRKIVRRGKIFVTLLKFCHFSPAKFFPIRYREMKSYERKQLRMLVLKNVPFSLMLRHSNWNQKCLVPKKQNLYLSVVSATKSSAYLDTEMVKQNFSFRVSLFNDCCHFYKLIEFKLKTINMFRVGRKFFFEYSPPIS